VKELWGSKELIYDKIPCKEILQSCVNKLSSLKMRTGEPGQGEVVEGVKRGE
jgi:hypothetical protein